VTVMPIPILAHPQSVRAFASVVASEGFR